MARHDEMVTDDFTPGYPIDLRSPKRRTHMAQGPTGDFEGMAARVVARLTGEKVLLQDDGSKPGMPDIRIDYAARPPAYVEAVVDIDTAYAAIEAAWLKPPRLIPDDQVWHVSVADLANRKQLRRDLRAMIRDLRELPGPHVALPVRTGVSITGPSEPTTTQPGGVYLYVRPGSGVMGSPIAAWPVFLDWINSFLASSSAADIRSKLAATGAAERHAFVGASFTTPGDAYFALEVEHWPELSSADPFLPQEITHLWVWATPGWSRCLAWFPNTRWFDVMDHWASP